MLPRNKLKINFILKSTTVKLEKKPDESNTEVTSQAKKGICKADIIAFFNTLITKGFNIVSLTTDESPLYMYQPAKMIKNLI